MRLLSRLEDALVGTTLAERYRLDRVVGSGGFGVVFAGHHVRLDVPIAVKVLHVEHASADARRRTVDRFLQEAKTLAQLRHPHIARVLDSGTRDADGDLPELSYLVLEWCEGPTLSRHLARVGTLSREACWRLMRPIVDAVAYAHEQNVVHRDLKPDNIIVVDGSPRVLDFGIAKVMESGEESPDATSTRSEQRAFTPGYAAPEQVAGTRTGPWTDVHALGLIFTELLVGKRPYVSIDGAELYREVLAEERPTPRRHGVDAGAWEAVIQTALHIDPSERYPNARRLAKALDQAAPLLDTVAAHDDDTAVEVASRPPATTTPIPPRSVAAPRSVDRTETLEPATVDGRKSWRSPVWALAAVALVAGAVGVYRLTVHRGDTAVTPERAPSAPAPTVSSVPQPAPATTHPIDGYDLDLLERRIVAEGFTIAEQRLGERDPLSEKSRFNIRRGEALGFVSVQRWFQAQHMRGAVSYLEPLEGRLQRKVSCLLYVQVTGDPAASQRLFDALTAGGEGPLPASAPVASSKWTRIPVPARAVLRAIWTDHRGTLFVAGHHGVVLRRDASGWNREATGTTDDLYDVWGRSPDDLFAVGERGTIIRREHGRWSVEKSDLTGEILAVGGNRDRTVAVSQSSLTERIGAVWTRFDDEEQLRNLASAIVADDTSVSVIEGRDAPSVYQSTAPGRWVVAGTWPASDGSPWPFIRVGHNVVARAGAAWAHYANEKGWKPLAFAHFAGELILVGERGLALMVDPSLTETIEETGVEVELHDVVREGDGKYYAVGGDGVVLERRP